MGFCIIMIRKKTQAVSLWLTNESSVVLERFEVRYQGEPAAISDVQPGETVLLKLLAHEKTGLSFEFDTPETQSLTRDVNLEIKPGDGGEIRITVLNGPEAIDFSIDWKIDAYKL